MVCEFIDKLSKLKKSSAESVDNIFEFDEFNQYMHVTRQIENELKEILRKVSPSDCKTLVLLCGSAGDGKSHLLSYLKHGDSENLLKKFKVINDATESDAPMKTSMETLRKRLDDFADENLNSGNDKVILAINLGILNKFIESEWGQDFKILKKYVEDNKILVGNSSTLYQENCKFQHVTFSDYQMFSITSEGIKTDYLNRLLDKVFNSSEANPFYEKFKDASRECSHCKYCPVRHNYALLQEKKYREYLIGRIVEVILKDRVIISTRDVLDLIYNILVSPNFTERKLHALVTENESAFLDFYVGCTTPMLLDEYKDISDLQNYMSKYDILKIRKAKSDEEAITFHTIEDVRFIISETIENTPYSDGMRCLFSDKFLLPNGELKTSLFKFLKRLEWLKKTDFSTDKAINEFVKFIYEENTNNIFGLEALYASVDNAIKCWNGVNNISNNEDYVCFDSTNKYFWMLEKISIEQTRPEILLEKIGKQLVKSTVQNSIVDNIDELYRFSPVVKLWFGNNIPIRIDVDFHLYKLLKAIRKGYKISAGDKNFYAEFNGSVNKIIEEYGQKGDEVRLISKINPEKEIVFRKSKYGGKIVVEC